MTDYLNHAKDCYSLRELADKLSLDFNVMVYRMKQEGIYENVVGLLKTNRLNRRIAKLVKKYSN